MLLCLLLSSFPDRLGFSVIYAISIADSLSPSRPYTAVLPNPRQIVLSAPMYVPREPPGYPGTWERFCSFGAFSLARP